MPRFGTPLDSTLSQDLSGRRNDIFFPSTTSHRQRLPDELSRKEVTGKNSPGSRYQWKEFTGKFIQVGRTYREVSLSGKQSITSGSSYYREASSPGSFIHRYVCREVLKFVMSYVFYCHGIEIFYEPSWYPLKVHLRFTVLAVNFMVVK